MSSKKLLESLEAIRAKKIVTPEGLTDLSKAVVAPKVGVTRHAQRYESTNEARSTGSSATGLCQSGNRLQKPTAR